MIHPYPTPEEVEQKHNETEKNKNTKWISFTQMKKTLGATEREKERTEGGQAEKRTIPRSYVGECPGYK